MNGNRKGKLRKQEPIKLGKQYAGARVSRDALDAGSDDDPFGTHTEDESSNVDDDDFEDEEESSGSEALEMDPVVGKARVGMESQEDDEEEEEEEGEEEESEGEEVGDDDSEEPTSGVEDFAMPVNSFKSVQKRSSSDVRHPGREQHPADTDDRKELRRLMASDQKTIAATISQAVNADAAKGRAVKEQRTTFDALLNTRIKMQKGLGVVNDLSAMNAAKEDGANGVETGSDEAQVADAEAIKSAELAALALWSTLEQLRAALADAHSEDQTKKRKRSPVSSTTTTSTLWERMSDLESESRSHRRSILDKWSSKVRGTSTSLPNARGKLLGSASGQQTITTVLDAHVATELGDRSSKRVRQNGATKETLSAENAEPIYDDTIFYQSLLRELVEQRMSSSEAMTGGLDNLSQLPSRLPIHPVTGMRNDKVKRAVDTRASKGRKMRFTVHEKLQNFMAPEDRGSWTVRARDEFFASLLGKTASGLLGEEDESESEGEDDHEREEGGLRLFRN